MGDPVVTQTDRERVVDWMVQHIGSVLEMPKDNFPIEERFDAYGLDSIEAVIMAGLMEEEFGVPIDPMTLFQNPSVAKFADFLAPLLSERS